MQKGLLNKCDKLTSCAVVSSIVSEAAERSCTSSIGAFSAMKFTSENEWYAHDE